MIIDNGLALYDEESHHHHAFVYLGHDPAVCAHAFGALNLWMLGYPEQSARHAQEEIALAKRLDHAPTLAVAMWFLCDFHVIRGDDDRALAISHLTASDVTPHSGKDVWWICQLGHEWHTPIYHRTARRRTGCPVCYRNR